MMSLKGGKAYQEAQDRAAAGQLADQGDSHGCSHQQPDGLDEPLCAMGHIRQGQLADQLPHQHRHLPSHTLLVKALQ